MMIRHRQVLARAFGQFIRKYKYIADIRVEYPDPVNPSVVYAPHYWSCWWWETGGKQVIGLCAVDIRIILGFTLV